MCLFIGTYMCVISALTLKMHCLVSCYLYNFVHYPLNLCSFYFSKYHSPRQACHGERCSCCQLIAAMFVFLDLRSLFWQELRWVVSHLLISLSASQKTSVLWFAVMWFWSVVTELFHWLWKSFWYDSTILILLKMQ